jgi:hypothetical protein
VPPVPQTPPDASTEHMGSIIRSTLKSSPSPLRGNDSGPMKPVQPDLRAAADITGSPPLVKLPVETSPKDQCHHGTAKLHQMHAPEAPGRQKEDVPSVRRAAACAIPAALAAKPPASAPHSPLLTRQQSSCCSPALPFPWTMSADKDDEESASPVEQPAVGWCLHTPPKITDLLAASAAYESSHVLPVPNVPAPASIKYESSTRWIHVSSCHPRQQRCTAVRPAPSPVHLLPHSAVESSTLIRETGVAVPHPAAVEEHRAHGTTPQRLQLSHA